ncbi:MAG: hypothetical protein IKJ83_00270 [Ruminococcus sp.]|nr:hypothetical protein [Ruminococcus sp.]
MNNNFSFSIEFSGIILRFSLPTKIIIPQCFSDLLCEDTDTPTAEYQVQLLSQPLRPEGYAVFERNDFSVYSTEEGFLRIYTPLTAEDGCQVACLIRESGKNILYYPASLWHRYKEYWHSTHLLCGELLLRYQNAILLHSSVVEKHGKVLLFCGESGAGKSTQASLWKQYQNAEILNGDRCVIRYQNGAFFGGGSPWSGTSGIYRREQHPIAGIITLKKAPVNSVKPLGAKAFQPLLSQTTLNTWDKSFMTEATEFLVQLCESVPIFELSCRPDKEATDLIYNTVFREEDTP